MTEMKELRSIFLEVRERLIAESHQLMTELNSSFEGDYESAIGTTRRMLEVFNALKVLSKNSEAFLGAIEAEERVADVKSKLESQLREFKIPLEALKRHRAALRETDLDELRDILNSESEREDLYFQISQGMDPTISGLMELFPQVFESAEESNSGYEIDDGLDEEKAALARSLAVSDDCEAQDERESLNAESTSGSDPDSDPGSDPVSDSDRDSDPDSDRDSDPDSDRDSDSSTASEGEDSGSGYSDDDLVAGAVSEATETLLDDIRKTEKDGDQ